MESIRKLEYTVAQWYEKAPHLPVKGQVWLAQNIWWIGLVGLVIGAFGVLSVLAVTFWASTAIGVYGGVAGAIVGSLAFIAVLIALAFSIVLLALLGMAIAPLKAGKKKGWDLLFISALLSLASTAVGFLLSFNFGSLIVGLFGTAVMGYFLFEIHSYFKVYRLEIGRDA
ncbi:hypothetical protein D3C85_1390850 [compost metagenome]